jgi:hypothetical protein
MMRPMITKLWVGVGLLAATLGVGAAAQVSAPAPDPAPLSKSIVGLWRGDALYCDNRTTFGRTSVEMRFNDYGTVTVRRGPYSGCGIGRPLHDSFTGDYLVVGNSVIISMHQTPGIVTIPGITITGDQWESLGGSGGNQFIGSALLMKRQ